MADRRPPLWSDLRTGDLIMLFDTVSLVLEAARHPTNPKCTVIVYHARGRRESLLTPPGSISWARILAWGGDLQ